MPDSTAALPHTIQGLLDKRHAHVQTLANIDATLARVNTALGGASVVKRLQGTASTPRTGGIKKATSNGQTGNEFVLGFIGEKKNPTSQEINAAWKASGRNRNADITLSLLTKAKKLRRVPLGPGIRGSRYSIHA